MATEEPRKSPIGKNTLAVGSAALGITSLGALAGHLFFVNLPCFLNLTVAGAIAIAACILGIIALVRMGKDPGSSWCVGYAVLGIVFAVLPLLVFLVFAFCVIFGIGLIELD